MLDEINLRQKEDMEKSQREVAEMLKRTQEGTVLPINVVNGVLDSSESDEDEGEVTLEQLGERIADGESISMNDLPKSLRDEFLRDISNGNAKHLIESWKPWWLMPENMHNTVVSNSLSSVPCIRSYLFSGDFKDVTLPSHCNSCLPYHCIEILFFYCLSMRLYNGDLEESEVDISECILRLSQVLSQSAIIQSMDKCVASLMCNENLLELARSEDSTKSPASLEMSDLTLPHPNGTLKEYVLRRLSDVAAVFEIPHFAIDAMAHCTILFRHYYAKYKRKDVLLAEKKCTFLTTFLRKMSTEEFWLLQKEVGIMDE